MTNLIVCFDTYPEAIFKWITKVLLYTLVPVGISAYMPMEVLGKFNLLNFDYNLYSINYYVCFLYFL